MQEENDPSTAQGVTSDPCTILRRQAFRFCLKPNEKDLQRFWHMAGCRRKVWNLAHALQQQRLANSERLFTYSELAKQLLVWKSDPSYAYLKDCHSQVLQQTLMDLDRAYKDAFDPKSPKRFPQFKKRGVRESFRFPQGVRFDNRRVYLPKMGWIRFYKSQAILGTIKNVTVSLRADKWHIAVQTERQVFQPQPQSAEEAQLIGIDMGIAQFATCSDRTVIAPVNSFKKAQKKLAFQQRWLARKEKFSHHWQKLRLKIARLHAHIADIRNDFLNKLTSKLSNNHAGIVLEDLQVSAMSRSAKGTSDSPGRNVKAKSGLNRSILDQGWYAFREKLAYKLQWLGKPLILVAPKNTSLTCASCGHIAKENRPSRSRFSCQACGHEAHADANAAENILAAGRAASARGEPALARSVKREPLPVGFGLPAGIPSL